MLDKTETTILKLLEDDGRLSYAELGEKVGLSKSPCWSLSGSGTDSPPVPNISSVVLANTSTSAPRKP